MRRNSLLSVLAAAVLITMVVSANAQAVQTVAALDDKTPTPSNIRVILDGNDLTFDQPPIIEDRRTFVPLRVIFEAFGAEVNWNQSTMTVTATKDDTKIEMKIDSPSMKKNFACIQIMARHNKRSVRSCRFVSPL